MSFTGKPDPRPTGITWIWIGVAVMTAGALALFRLGGNVTRVILGAAALAVCLGLVAVMLWLDSRAERETRRLTGRR